MPFILINLADNADTPGDTPHVDVGMELVVRYLLADLDCIVCDAISLKKEMARSSNMGLEIDFTTETV
jgi:hypothetical protein